MTTSAEKIADILALAAPFEGKGGNTTISIAAASAEPITAETINRVGGAIPFGITDETWPRARSVEAMFGQSYENEGKEFDGDYRMDHVFTLDVRGLKHLGLPKEVAAVALFVSNIQYNEAWESGSGHAEVVLLTEAQLALGEYTGALPRGQEGRGERFDLVHVKVPYAIFTSRDDDGDVGALRSAIYNSAAYFGGEPMWLQGDPDEDYYGDDGDDYEGDDDGGSSGGDEDPAVSFVRSKISSGQFIGQHSEGFGYVNLGDSGEMYVFGHDAFWQCY
jgi:hypothetical protein